MIVVVSDIAPSSRRRKGERADNVECLLNYLSSTHVVHGLGRMSAKATSILPWACLLRTSPRLGRGWRLIDRSKGIALKVRRDTAHGRCPLYF